MFCALQAQIKIFKPGFYFVTVAIANPGFNFFNNNKLSSKKEITAVDMENEDFTVPETDLLLPNL